MEHHDQVSMRQCSPAQSGYCLLIRTVCEGVVPYERDSEGNPVIYGTLHEVQQAFIEGIIDRLEQFLAGEREFCDAMTIEEYIAEIEICPDGAVSDSDGNLFKADA
jgi:hypothetical protein